MERQLILHGTNGNLLHNIEKDIFEVWREGHLSEEIFTNDEAQAIKLFKFNNPETWSPSVEGF